MPITLEQFVVLALATWRISELLVREDGPDYIFERLRHWAGVRRSPEGEAYPQDDSFLANVLVCVLCTSVWVGLGLSLGWMLLPTVTLSFALPFAMSAVACALTKIVG